MDKKKLNAEQLEQLDCAMDCIRMVKNEIEETGKNKRIANALDKAIGILYDVIWR